MSVYVDDAGIPYGRMIMCHMIADTHTELVEMADRIGVQRKWLQHPNTPWEYFDICLTKRQRALLNGAIEVSRRDLVLKLKRKRGCNEGTGGM